jgi:Flp pilus assembly protein TadD
MPKHRPLLLLLLLALLLPAALARAHVEHGSMPDPVAVMEYRILLEFKPEDTTTRNLLAMALLRMGKLTEAEKEFRQILQAAPGHFDARDGLGLTLLRQKRTAEAVRELQRAVRARPDDIEVHLHLGRALTLDRQTAAARRTLQTGLTLLERQPPSPARERQRGELQTALRELPVPSGSSAPIHKE